MNPLDKLRAWVSAHRGPVAAAGIGGVAAFALYQRHKNGSATVPANATSSPNVAGLTAAPVADPVDPNANLTAAIGNLGDLIGSRLPVPKPTVHHPPKPPPRLPGPGRGRYVIRQGDTLTKISERLFGVVNAHTLNRLRTANPRLGTFGDRASLNYWAGDRIVVPRVQAPPRQPKQPVKSHPPIKRQDPDKRKKKG